MKRLIVFSGAGLSAESGIPTFRDAGGLWEGHDVNEVANWLTLKRNKELVYKFYNERRIQMASVEPNDGHNVLARLQQSIGKDRVVFITQNVDNLLERAGCSNILHVHGHIDYGQCLANPFHTWRLDGDIDMTTRCPSCGGGVKPGVVLFNERAHNYPVMYRVFKSLTAADVFIVIGTNGAVIYPADALKSRAHKILITKENGMYDANDFHEVYNDNATTVLKNLESRIRLMF